MFGRIRDFGAPLLLALVVALGLGSAALAQDAAWRVSKSSGDVSVTTAGGQQTELAEGAIVKPGDNIRTGQNGRVLLMRGQETILISPNSVMGISAAQKDALKTTILQQAGSILLEVEKRNVNHFSVETPYLAAVVKGTQFRVTVGSADSRVEVLKGQVEVADFKSGQFALVRPDQAAKVSAQGQGGLSLSGSGALSVIQQGMPRSSSVSPLATAKEAVASREAKLAAEPVRVASALGEARPGHASFASGSSNEGGWTSGFASWGSGIMSSGSKQNRQEDMALAAAIACGVGFLVAVLVGAVRRRKNRKTAEG